MTLPVRGTVALLMFSPVNTSKNLILHSPDTFHSLSLSFINIFYIFLPHLHTLFWDYTKMNTLKSVKITLSSSDRSSKIQKKNLLWKGQAITKRLQPTSIYIPLWKEIKPFGLSVQPQVWVLSWKSAPVLELSQTCPVKIPHVRKTVIW